MDKVFLYDATLREGNQAEEISFSVEDKIRITSKLDEIGIDFIEGGWPSSNPRDFNYFKEVKSLNLKHAIVTAFGSTAKPGVLIEKDVNLNDLLHADTEAVTIFGKAWDLHVTDVLGIEKDENLKLVEESILFVIICVRDAPAVRPGHAPSWCFIPPERLPKTITPQGGFNGEVRRIFRFRHVHSRR